MNTWILDIETLLTFFLFILTPGLTYGHRLKSFPKVCSLGSWLVIYHVLSRVSSIFLSSSLGSYLVYVALFALCGGTYAFFFVTSDFKNVAVLMLVYFCSINSCKGIASLLQLPSYIQTLHPSAQSLLTEVILFLLLILCTIFLVGHPLKISVQMPPKYWMVVMAIPVLLVTVTQVYIVRANSTNSASTNHLTFFLIVEVCALSEYYLSYIMANSYDKLYESKNINRQLQLQLDNVERSIGMIEQIRRDKHEMKNVYFYIGSLVNDKNYEELDAFVNEKLMHRFDMVEEFKTGNSMVDAVLTQKVSEAREYSIHVVTNVLLPPDLSVASDDLCGLLLNLFDNAIDASKSEPTGDIHVSIKEMKGHLAIRIKNKSSIDVLQENPHLKTSKPDASHHGIGLKVIKSIVNKYDGIMNTYMNNGYFVVDVMLCVTRTPSSPS